MQAEKSRGDKLRERFDRFLSGRAPSDPLYLTNRTWKKKVALVSLIALPVLILIALVTIGSVDLFRFHRVDPDYHSLAEAPPPAIAPKPVSDPTLRAANLEVVDIRLIGDVDPPMVTGTIRNNTSEEVDSVEVSYYLADGQGSLIGSESTVVRHVPPRGSVIFRAPLKMAKAEYVLVREVHPN